MRHCWMEPCFQSSGVGRRLFTRCACCCIYQMNISLHTATTPLIIFLSGTGIIYSKYKAVKTYKSSSRVNTETLAQCWYHWKKKTRFLSVINFSVHWNEILARTFSTSLFNFFFAFFLQFRPFCVAVKKSGGLKPSPSLSPCAIPVQKVKNIDIWLFITALLARKFEKLIK